MNTPFIDCHTHVGLDSAFYSRNDFPYALDYPQLLEQAQRNGIQRVVVFPFVTYVGFETEGNMVLTPSKDNDFLAPYAFENRRLCKEIYELHNSLSSAAIPFAIMDPARRQQDQATALRRLCEDFPVKGLKIQSTIIQAPIRRLLDEGSCLLDFAREKNLPVLIHSSINPADLWAQCSDILDVAEARPDVRFCLAHSCRFDRASLDRVGELPNTWFDCSAHCIHCDLAADTSGKYQTTAPVGARLETDYTRPEVVMKSLYDLLPTKMMWGSDAPFYSYVDKNLKLLSTYEREVDALKLLSDSEKKAILHDNILSFLGNV